MTQEELLAGIVIPIDKPCQWTSFQAVNKVKAAIRNRYGLKKFKIGHAGTLDPLATGLLLVCVGKATKIIDQLQAGEKVYSGTFVIGATTPCYDMERAIDHRYPHEHVTPDRIREVIPQFLGSIQQVPPLFSAVKIDGQRAYKYAREGEAPEPTSKTVAIHEFELTGFRPGAVPHTRQTTLGSDTSAASQQPAAANVEPGTHLYDRPQCVVPPELPQADFRIKCGKGTYIRSIARDLGLALDSGAFLSALRREQVGRYTLREAVSLDHIAAYFEQAATPPPFDI